MERPTGTVLALRVVTESTGPAKTAVWLARQMAAEPARFSVATEARSAIRDTLPGDVARPILRCTPRPVEVVAMPHRKV